MNITDHNEQKQNSGTIATVNNVGKFECERCDASFTCRKSLTQHNKSVHEGIRYECDRCDYKATTKGHLRRHQKTQKHKVKL